MLIIPILGNNNIRCLMPGAQWAQKQVISLSLDGSLFVHLGNRFQHGSAWYAQAIHITWHGKFFGQHDKNATKIPISTPWTVIRTSEEGGGGWPGLKRPMF